MLWVIPSTEIGTWWAGTAVPFIKRNLKFRDGIATKTKRTSLESLDLRHQPKHTLNRQTEPAFKWIHPKGKLTDACPFPIYTASLIAPFYLLASVG